MKEIEEYKILSARTKGELETQVKGLMTDGWKPVGGHQVETIHMQNVYAGNQHKHTTYQREYTQTIIR